MSKIRQYRPNYFSGFENETKEFSSLKELLSIEWVDSFRNQPDFHQFSINNPSSHSRSEYTLMAEYKNGNEWWVVGFIDENEIIKELPIWAAKYDKTKKTSNNQYGNI